jgi:signal transduction histidine kinase/ActR/RegA family two-component response regulator
MQDTASHPHYAQSTLDAVSFSVLLLDQNGIVLSTNKLWRDSFPARDGDRPKYGAGGNYLADCDFVCGPNAGSAREMAAGIRSVLHGSEQDFAFEYPWDERWFNGKVTRFEDNGAARAVVTCLDISARRTLELNVIRELTVQKEEIAKRAAELVTANTELAYQNEEKSKRAAELFIANVELAYQKDEKSKRAAELVIANTELAYQNEEKSKRAAELLVANVELAYQNEEKGKRAVELAIANAELALQNEERGRRAAELQIARDAAESASLVKSSFLANMSHEIRTPLGAIYGMANLIAKEPLSASQVDRMSKLQAAFKHLSGTINSILDFSKIEANKLVLEEGPVLLDQMMANIAAMVQASIQDKGLELHLHIEGMPPNLLGDSTRLAQALLNYAANAVKFTEVGSIRISAHVVEDTAETTLVRMEVQDTGMGIAASMLPKLFEPFIQSDSSTSRIYGGSGLGLAITKRLAEAMGGDAGVKSKPGHGSTFWLTARLRKGSGSDISHPNEHISNAAEILSSDYKGLRVLLVEDDDFNREIGSILLTDVGLNVDFAEDGEVAVGMAATNLYDLIIMDMQMPKLDGLEATRRIRAAPAGYSVPIIAMTANAFKEDKMRCIASGMDDFVTKPVEPSALYQAILHQFQSSEL